MSLFFQALPKSPVPPPILAGWSLFSNLKNCVLMAFSEPTTNDDNGGKNGNDYKIQIPRILSPNWLILGTISW